MGGGYAGWGSSRIEYIYFIRSGPFVKIGRTTSAPYSRITTMQTGNPYELEPVFYIRIYKRQSQTHIGEKFEKLIHNVCAQDHYRGEWFRYPEAVNTFFAQLYTVKNVLANEKSVRFFSIGTEPTADIKFWYAT